MGLAACNKLTDCGIPPVLLLDLGVLATSYIEEGPSTYKGGDGNNTNNDACSNGTLVDPCFGMVRC